MASPITSPLSFLTAELYGVPLQLYSAVRVTALIFLPHFHSSCLTSILCQVNHQRDIPAFTGSFSVLGSCLHAGDVCWQLSGNINGRKILALTRQRGGSSSKGDGNHGKVAQCVLPKGLSYIQVNSTRKHNACRRQEVQIGGSSIQHLHPITLHLLPCHTGRSQNLIRDLLPI